MDFMIRLDKGDYLAEDYEFQSTLACMCNDSSTPCPLEMCPFPDKFCEDVRRQDWEDFLTKEFFPNQTVSNYSKCQEEWLSKNNIKTSTTVRVIRKAESHELGWCNEWASDMDACVGKIGRADLIENYGSYGIEIRFDNEKVDGMLFPYFVLEKVED